MCFVGSASPASSSYKNDQVKSSGGWASLFTCTYKKQGQSVCYLREDDPRLLDRPGNPGLPKFGGRYGQAMRSKYFGGVEAAVGRWNHRTV